MFAATHRGQRRNIGWRVALALTVRTETQDQAVVVDIRYPTPPRPTSAAPGPAHLLRIHAKISGRSTKSRSGANGTVEKGSRFPTGLSLSGCKRRIGVSLIS
jgi:hypothetical protein